MSVEKEIRKILAEATPASVRAKQDLVRSGLGGRDKNASAVIKALENPEAAMKNPAKREMLLKVMQDLLDVVVNDPSMVSKTKTALRKEEVEELEEKLVGGQKKLDANKNGKLDAEDFKKLRGEANKPKAEDDEEDEDEMDDEEDKEDDEEMEDDEDEKETPEPRKNFKGFKKGMKEEKAEEGYVSHAQRKAVWASRNDEKEAKKRKMKKEEIQVDEQYAIKHKLSKQVLSTHKDMSSAKDEWKGIDKDQRHFYHVVAHSKPAKSHSMKEDLQLEQAPVAPAPVKHRIAVTVSEPDHTMVTKRKEQVLKHVVVSHGPDKKSAQKLGEKFYKKKGYKVHGSEHAGIKEEVKLDEAVNRPQPNLPSMSSDDAVANAQNRVQRQKKYLELLKAQDKTTDYETQRRKKENPIPKEDGFLRSLSMKNEAAFGKDKAANLKAALDRHSEKAIAANKAGDDMAVKVHQSKMNMLKNKMAKMAKESVTTNYNMVKGQTQNKNPTKKLATDYTAVIRNIKTDKTQKEEIDQINELKKSTVKSYLQKKMNKPGVPSQKDVSGMANATVRLMNKKPTSEEIEQLDELSPATKASYVAKAKDQIKQSVPYTKKGEEYRDIAKNFIKKREKGIAKAMGLKEGYGEDDIANGGTVIYKHEGKHYMSKVSHKTGGGAGTKVHTSSALKHVVPLHHVVSTDASDWNKFKNASVKEENEVVEDKNDYQRKIEKNNKNFIAASKRQKNPLTNVHTAKTKMKPVKEEEQVDEAFPTVDDAKKRMKDALKSKYDKKKISTGTVYTKKYKEEPEDEKKSDK